MAAGARLACHAHSMIDVPIRYARSGALEIAYRTVGDGPIDVVFVQGWLTHLQVLSEEPAYRRFCEAISGFCRLITFDKRGMGLSDRTEVGTLEDRMDDVRAILDDLGSERAVLFGNSEGAPCRCCSPRHLRTGPKL